MSGFWRALNVFTWTLPAILLVMAPIAAFRGSAESVHHAVTLALLILIHLKVDQLARDVKRIGVEP